MVPSSSKEGGCQSQSELDADPSLILSPSKCPARDPIARRRLHSCVAYVLAHLPSVKNSGQKKSKQRKEVKRGMRGFDWARNNRPSKKKGRRPCDVGIRPKVKEISPTTAGPAGKEKEKE